MDKDEQIQQLRDALMEQYKWFTGRMLREVIANLIATRLYELGWRKIGESKD